MFTEATKQAICYVAQVCAQDMEYEYASDPEVVAETAIDASRLTTFGFPGADAEVVALITEHGYSKVLMAIAEFVPTA